MHFSIRLSVLSIFVCLICLFTDCEQAFGSESSFPQTVFFQHFLCIGMNNAEAKKQSIHLLSNPNSPMARGLLQLNSLEYTEALKSFGRVRREEPLFLESLIFRASCYEGNNANTQALLDFDMALKLNRNKARVLLCRSLLFSREKKFSSAIRDIASVRSPIQKKTELYLRMLGQYHYEKENFKKALYYFRQASILEPKCSQAFGRLGLNYVALGDYKLAAKNLQQAVEREPTHPILHVLYGRILSWIGDLNAANVQCGKALEICPRLSSALELKGDVLLDQSRWGEAAECYKDAQAFDKTKKRTASKLPTKSPIHNSKFVLDSGNLKDRENDYQVVLKAVALLPSSILNSLYNNGVKISICPTVKSVKGAKETVANGVYSPRTRVIEIGEDSILEYHEWRYQSEFTVLHEIGHAYSDLDGRVSGEIAFKRLYAEEISLLQKSKDNQMYFSKHLEGCGELYADLFAEHFLGFERMPMRSPSLFFPKCRNWVDDHLPKGML